MNKETLFPEHLELWMEGDILKYRCNAGGSAGNTPELVIQNRDFLQGVLQETGSSRILLLPLAHNQKALWFLHGLCPENTSYNISLAAEIKEPFNTGAFKQTLDILISRHEMLRTIFAELPGSDNLPCQMVLETISPDIEETGGKYLTPHQIRDLLTSKYKVPFDPGKGPMFRVAIVRSASTIVVAFTFHHMICDAISLKNLFSEFIGIYDSVSGNNAGVLIPAPPAAGYSDFIFSQQEFLESEEGKSQLDYWTKELRNINLVLNIPCTFPRPTIHRFNGSTILFRIEGERLKNLRAIARQKNSTINILLLSVFQFFISKITRQPEFCVGIPAAARKGLEFGSVFGYFINLLPVSCSLSEKNPFSGLLNETRKKFCECFDNQNVPFPVIVEKISPKRDMSRTPVFQVLFNYLNRRSLGPLLYFLGDPESGEYSSWGSLNIRPYKIYDQEGQFDLTLEIVDDDEKLICALKYNNDIIDRATAELYQKSFLEIADLITGDLDIMPWWLAEKQPEKPEKNSIDIYITGTFTVEPVQPGLEFWLRKSGMEPSVKFPGYNQVFPQLLNPSSEFNSNHNGWNILLIRPEDWLKNVNSKDPASEFYRKINEFEDALSFSLNLNRPGKYIVALCPPSPGILTDPDRSVILSEASEKLACVLQSISGCIFIGASELTGTYGVIDYYEELGEKDGHIPYTEDFFTSLSTIAARKIHASSAQPFKAIAVDCDNTLWRGVVAEEGASGVTVGKPERELQEFLIEQSASGMLVCLCSKNLKEDVFEVFEKNDGMVLRKEHLSFNRINWNPKSANLYELAREINIGIDSFIFIDDSPMECAEVRNNAPEVLVLQVPEGGFIKEDLKNSWIFDRLKVTEEDRKRSEKYKQEAVRSDFRTSVKSYKDFISGLELKIDIRPFSGENIPRISQLTYRTNQFNFTTLRKSESEITEISRNSDYECFQVSLSDRFGDYGLTGVMITDKTSGYTVETLLLSCRVLGKGVEHALISFLGERALKNNSEYLYIRFRKTEKNIPAERFITSNFSYAEQSDEGGIQIFKIPAEKACNLAFDPEAGAEAPVTDGEYKMVKAPENKTAGERNGFYYGITEKCLTLGQITSEMNKNTVHRQTQGKRSLSGDSQTETEVLTVWQQVLKRDDFTSYDNFFDIGGHSVLIPGMVIRLAKQFGIKINIVDIFQYPTVHDLAAYINGRNEQSVHGKDQSRSFRSAATGDIAIIGLAGRFPGAANVDEFWNVISSGKEAITYYTYEELLSKGVDPVLLGNKNYVFANGLMDTADRFDSSFFGITPREADFMDPQHRVFLETCYEALENAGYAPEKFQGEMGVFAGCGMNNYLVKNLFQHHESLRSIGEFQTIINNNSDYLTTRVSYNLNLTGPSIDIQTACSTSLVAIHTACQNLISGSCDIALAGGVFIPIPHGEGYMYEPGGIFSPDGHCRPFDSRADGTLFGEGSGVVVLKRLEDALRDHDTISGVIKGTAINNDGSVKVGYMAPSVKGQASVVKKAIAMAGIRPESVSYIETHGTGTKMGDPVEVTALASVFGNHQTGKATCAIGSVKANIGHLDAAAGVTGVIKVILMLKNRKLVPLVNFQSPNPELPLENSPFYINTSFTDWTPVQGKRIAGGSSFGIGGTNAHCILEEAPETVKERSACNYHLLPVTARTPGALKTLRQRIADFVPSSIHDIADISFTLQQGRTHYKYRSLLAGIKNAETGAAGIAGYDISGVQELINPRVVFMFTGQGSQYPGMTKGLYNGFDTYRKVIDISAAFLRENFDIDILKFILTDESDELREEINQTSVAQPLLFTVQYGIAKLLEEFGIRPDAVIGHSIGEYAATCLAGVMEFKDALRIVCHRGMLMQAQEPGDMVAVHLPVEKILPFINHSVSIALKNAPGLNVVSGRRKDIENFSNEIMNSFPDARISEIRTSHAFHSYMMDPVLDPFGNILRNVKFGKCNIPFVSNITGTWVTGDEISDAGYWIRQIREPVNFAGGIQELLRNGNSYFLEIGPGNSLASLLSRFRNDGEKIYVSSTSRHPGRAADDVRVFFEAAGQAWVTGANIKWDDLYRNEKRYRVPLPSYPFERKRHWIDPKVPFSYFAECTGTVNSSDEKDYPGEESADAGNRAASGSLHLRPEMETGYVAPVTENEKIVVRIWEDLLGISGIGIEDDFFVLGGHSLLASQVITRIREKLFVRLDLESMCAAPTIRGLMTKIETAPQLKTGEYKIISLNQAGRLPISFDQKRLWILNQIDQNNPAYNIPFTYRLKGHLDVNVFIRSLKVLFDRQAILRSSIRSFEGEPFCMLNSYETIPVTVLDFTHYTASETEKVIQEYFAAESRKKFDIENGPLFRLFLVKLNEAEHIFHMTVQHMIFDGWSWGIFAGELRQIYNDSLNNRPVGLKSLQLQYYDLASWQNKHINRDGFSDSIVYWKEQLKDHPPEINFPFDRPRTRDISGFGGRETVRLSKDLSSEIISLSCRENSTVFMTMLSAFGLLLHKYSGDDDICIGAPTANRGNTATEQVIGLFVNTIIIRLRFERSLTFTGLLRSARKTTLDALAHQDLPFEILVDELHPERKINVNPVTQILFAYQNTPRPALDLEGIVPERVLIKDTVSPFDLTFYAWEAEGIIEGEIEFNSDLIDRNSVVRMKENFISILESAIDDPEQMISEIPVVSDHCRKILDGFNNTGVTIPDCLVHNFFEEQAACIPDKTAVVSDSERLTYRELNVRAESLSLKLKNLGAEPGNVVGIFLERSAGMIETVLGILKAGCCYLPLDPALPRERLRYMVEDSGAGIIISQDSLRDRAVYFPGVTFIIPGDIENPSHPSEGNKSEKTTSPDSPAYMIYTSGTTGRPKGVKVHHRAVVNLVKSMSKTPGISGKDNLLAVVTLSFDMSVFEIFLSLSNGATIVMAGSRDVTDGQRLKELIDRFDITVIQATPSLWSIILAGGWKGKPGLKALSGGEPLTPNLIKQLLPKTGELWNCYGPTETTVYSTCARIRSADSKVVIGKPLDNTKIFILDKYGKILPPGVTGEVAIGGAGVTKGYNNQPGLTSEKFIVTDDNDVIYKTGDLGRFLEDGNIELFGRNDHQVKIRGFRIELREIELLLSGIRGVNEVVIKLHRFGENDERLIGFLETNDDFSLEPCEINNLLKEKLPSYMLPYTYRIMKEFPRTHNGKIDRKALLFRLEDLGGDGNGKPENLTAVEKTIYEIWFDALKTDNIKVTDNFFDLGGNSLMAISVFSKILKAFNTTIPLRVFFDSPRIRDLADIVEVMLNKRHELHSSDQKKTHGSKTVIGEI